MEQNNIAPRALMIVAITALLVWAYTSMGIKFGQDLKGGTTLRFSLDIDGAKRAGLVDDQMPNEEIVAQTLEIIGERIDKYGLAEIQLTQYGDNKFLVSLPADAGTQPDAVVKVISQLGDLKFRIEVLPDSTYKARATDGPEPARMGLWKGTDEEFNTFKNEEVKVWQTARDRGEMYSPTRGEYLLVKRAKVIGFDRKETVPDGSEVGHFAIVESNSGQVDFDGGILTNPSVGENPNTGEPVVLYEVKNEFQNDFGRWTGANVGLPMAIILNNQYHSAPTINERLTKNVQITLGRGGSRKAKRDEAKALATVLQTGSLKIQPVLEAKNVMGPSLAGKSRDRGIQAILAAFALVLIFMIVYYRASGMVANVALLLNLVLLVGFMAFFQAVLTLPGIAGIVLTVGMAVDANILINERIREERRGGRSLARAVAEGYDRALSAIIDANVTSLITAIFLYNFGSGAVKGFAVTLAIGLVVSMFTAIFVTRTIMDWLMNAGIIKELSTHGSGEPPKVKWLGLRRIFGPLSVAGIVFGIVMFMSTDKYTLYDIDFTGGYRMQAAFVEKTTPDEVTELLSETKMDVDVEVTRFNDKGDRETSKVTVPVGPYPDAQVLSAGEDGRAIEINVQRLFHGDSQDEEAEAKAFREYMGRLLAERLMPDWQLKPIVRYNHVPKEGDAADDPLAAYGGGITGVIAFNDPDALLSPDTLKSILKDDLPFWTQEDGRDRAFKPAERGLTREVEVRAYPTASAGIAAYEFWLSSKTASGATPEANVSMMSQRMGEYLGGKGLKTRLGKDMPEGAEKQKKLERFGLSQPFPSEDAIGSTVAERLRDDAIVALFLSLVFIIFYIALRFRSRSMGFAAVLCLFHDVAITLGLVALANTLGIVDAKLNLAMVAAFLTLVGYSVNDTVVIFDRIRENRGKRPTIDAELINASINQTLARTIRTTATFLLVCFALFGFNYGQRNVLEGFSFLLILGSIIGTYSTIAISTPLLLYLPWLWERLKGFAPKTSMVTNCLSSSATFLLTPLAALAWLAWGAVFAAVAFVIGLVLFVPWSLSSDNDEAKAATA